MQASGFTGPPLATAGRESRVGLCLRVGPRRPDRTGTRPLRPETWCRIGVYREARMTGDEAGPKLCRDHHASVALCSHPSIRPHTIRHRRTSDHHVRVRRVPQCPSTLASAITSTSNTAAIRSITRSMSAKSPNRRMAAARSGATAAAGGTGPERSRLIPVSRQANDHSRREQRRAFGDYP